MNARQGFIDFLLFYFTNFFNKELQTAWKDYMILNFNSSFNSSFYGGWSLTQSVMSHFDVRMCICN